MQDDAFPDVEVPAGYRLVPEGGQAVYTETIAFRVTAEQFVAMSALRDTFPERTWAVTFRWLLTQRVVKDLVHARILACQDED